MENCQPIATISVSFEVSCLFTLLLVLMSHVYPLSVPWSYIHSQQFHHHLVTII